VTVAGNEITDSPGGIRWRLVSASGAAQFTPNFALEGNRFTGVARPLIRPDFVPPRGACP
jgi:hypothetical protein